MIICFLLYVYFRDLQNLFCCWRLQHFVNFITINVGRPRISIKIMKCMQQYEYLVMYIEVYRHIRNSWFSANITNVWKSNGTGQVNWTYTAWKVSKYGVFSGPYLPAFGLNTERNSVSLRIHSECGKIRARKNSVFGHFSRNDIFTITGQSILRNLWRLERFTAVLELHGTQALLPLFSQNKRFCSGGRKRM